jgi:hypothetical protein
MLDDDILLRVVSIDRDGIQLALESSERKLVCEPEGAAAAEEPRDCHFIPEHIVSG